MLFIYRASYDVRKSWTVVQLFSTQSHISIFLCLSVEKVSEGKIIRK